MIYARSLAGWSVSVPAIAAIGLSSVETQVLFDCNPTTVTDIETTNRGEASYTDLTTQLPGGSDFGTFLSDTIFYVTIQGVGTFNVAEAAVELNPVLNLVGGYDSSGLFNQGGWTWCCSTGATACSSPASTKTRFRAGGRSTG